MMKNVFNFMLKAISFSSICVFFCLFGYVEKWPIEKAEV